MKVFVKIVLSVCCVAFIGYSVAASRQLGDQLDFRVSVDKSLYSPGMRVNLTYTVANKGEVPIYIYRNLGICSSPSGFADLKVLDSHNHELALSGCSGETLPVKDTELVKWVTNPDLWILLQPEEVYEGLSSFKLPSKAGQYRLFAQLIPTGLSKTQKEILAEKRMRVLQSPINAPVVTVTAK
jgi:hypothetical protein